MRLWWALKKDHIKENYNYLTLHCSLGVDTKGHLISYLNIKNPNCGKGYAVPMLICFGLKIRQTS